MKNDEEKMNGLTSDREILKDEIMKLLDEIPLDRLKALYIKALVAKTLNAPNDNA